VIQQSLRSSAIFRELDDEELAQVLMAGMQKRFPQETVILTEGAPGGQLHVINQGRVRISKRELKHLSVASLLGKEGAISPM